MCKSKTVILTGWENNPLQSDLHRAACSLKLTQFKSLGALEDFFLKKRKPFRISKWRLNISKARERLKNSGQPFHSSNIFEILLLLTFEFRRL